MGGKVVLYAVLRAVYNKAVRRRLVEQAHSFREVYTGIDTTRKWAVSESVIVQLCGLALAEQSALALARDVFIYVIVVILKKYNYFGL